MSFLAGIGGTLSSTGTYTHPPSDSTEKVITNIAFTEPRLVSAVFQVGALSTNNTRLREYRSADGVTWNLYRSVTFNATANTVQGFTVDLIGDHVRYTVQTANEPSGRNIVYRVEIK